MVQFLLLSIHLTSIFLIWCTLTLVTCQLYWNSMNLIFSGWNCLYFESVWRVHTDTYWQLCPLTTSIYNRIFEEEWLHFKNLYYESKITLMQFSPYEKCWKFFFPPLNKLQPPALCVVHAVFIQYLNVWFSFVVKFLLQHRLCILSSLVQERPSWNTPGALYTILSGEEAHLGGHSVHCLRMSIFQGTFCPETVGSQTNLSMGMRSELCRMCPVN